jgi:hypothetical protein
MTMGALWAAALAVIAAAAAPLEAPPARGPQAATASTPTAAFDAAGTLWLVWVDGPHVYAGASHDLGRSFATEARVNPEPEKIDANGEARPKIAIGSKGEIFVSYTRKLDKPYTGDVRFSRSTDGGRTFSAPVTVNDDGLVTGHRFDTLAVSPAGEVHLFWIDKRDLERAAAQKQKYEGGALYQAVSTDGGQTFSVNRKLKDNVCECCRLAVAWDGDVPVLFWRDLMPGGVRDHSIARIEAKEVATERATDDGWEILGCPHHGPAFAIGADGTRHLAWFTGEGKRGKGTFYRRSADGGRLLGEPVRVASGPGSGRPQVIAAGRNVWLTWKETSDDETAIVYAVRSTDAGATWSKPQEVSRRRGASDHPLLVARGEAAYLSWFGHEEGYRLVPLPD